MELPEVQIVRDLAAVGWPKARDPLTAQLADALNAVTGCPEH